MESIRKPKKEELQLIKYLFDKCNEYIVFDINNLLVENMNDGGMGSLKLYPSFPIKNDRKFKRELISEEFFDSDGVKMIISLYIDNYDELFELDVWKVNFEPIIELPIIG